LTKSHWVIGWKVSSLALSMASVRYRAMLPLLSLEQAGQSCRVFSDADNAHVEELDLLVIVKSFTTEDLALVHRAVEQGVPVVLDLCDNIFISTYGASTAKVKASPARMFLAMARLCKCIVVTTEPLAVAVRERLDVQVPVHVIPDGLETRRLLEQMRSRLSAALEDQQRNLETRGRMHATRQRVARLMSHVRSMRKEAVIPLASRLLRRAGDELRWQVLGDRARQRFKPLRAMLSTRMAAHQKAPPAVNPPVDPDVKRILWFGNHGAPHARFGMLDLLEIRDALETIAKEFKVELVVVSNLYEKYERHIKPLAISSSYFDWTPATVKKQLALASVVVVPNSGDEFSLCKSANRTATALHAGVPVVARETPALSVLRDCIVMDDFVGGLRLYLTDKPRAASDVARGREVIAREFGPAAIATAWGNVIGLAVSNQRTMRPDGELVVALNIMQDLDVALPIMVQAVRAGVSVVAFCNVALLKKSPRLLEVLQQRRIAISMLQEDFPDDAAFQFPPSARMLLTAGESNLGPHRFSRWLTDAANRRSLFTATLQHGFENIGLTYDDEFQSADRIDFASRRIYLWGGLETLHPKVGSATRQKCIPMGCPKPARVPKAELGDLLHPFKTVIGVFENLHWTRYTDDYRAFFLQGVEALASRFPEVLFLVKPHHAGRWLSARFKGSVPTAANILIADPQSPAWEPHTAPSLMGHLQAIITSPSTVAIDAARQQLPVAVVAHQLHLANYDPLTLIRSGADWQAFVESALDAASREALVRHGCRFIGRTLLPDGAAERIVIDMMAHVPRKLVHRT